MTDSPDETESQALRRDLHIVVMIDRNAVHIVRWGYRQKSADNLCSRLNGAFPQAQFRRISVGKHRHPMTEELIAKLLSDRRSAFAVERRRLGPRVLDYASDPR